MESTNNSLSPRSMVFWRHIVGIAIILLVQHPRLYSNGMVFLGLWSGTVVIALGGAGLVTGLVYLFFTTQVTGKAWRIFVVVAWTFAVLQLFGEWALPTIVGSIASAPPKVPTTASAPPKVPTTASAPPKVPTTASPQKASPSALASYEKTRAGFNYDANGNLLVNFDVAGALKAGHSKSEIAEYLCRERKVDIAEIRGRGYSDDEIIAKLVAK